MLVCRVHFPYIVGFILIFIIVVIIINFQIQIQLGELNAVLYFGQLSPPGFLETPLKHKKPLQHVHLKDVPYL